MRKSRRIKEKPPTFYICDQQADCKVSNICGKDCKYTADISHAKYKTHNKFKRMADGSQWEKPAEGRYPWGAGDTPEQPKEEL